MSYQTIDLVYGVTLGKDEYRKVQKKLIKISNEMSDDDGDGDFDLYDIKEILGIVIYNGYYHDTYKIGFSLETDEVRTMQNFVFDFDLPSEKELVEILITNAALIEKIGLKPDDFSVGVCTYNY